MKKTVYEDFKYAMQDTSRLYIGTKFTFGELLENEDVPFRFQRIVHHYLMDGADMEDTLETQLYYLEKTSFAVRSYHQLKAKIKVLVLEEKKTNFGIKKEYVTKLLNIEELTMIPAKDKERMGMIVQELSVSKMAMLLF